MAYGKAAEEDFISMHTWLNIERQYAGGKPSKEVVHYS